MPTLSNFKKFNGHLRVVVLLLGVAAIGLTVSRFRKNEMNEVIFLGSCLFATTISLAHLFLSFLIGCNHGGQCFRIGDFVFHLVTGLILLVSSTLMLMVASKKGLILDYRFQDSKHVLARTVAAVIGLQSSGIYLLISYLTITEKQFIYCKRLSERKVKLDPHKVEAGPSAAAAAPSASTRTPVARTANASTVTNANPVGDGETAVSCTGRCLWSQLSWRRLAVDDVLEARLLALALGATNIGILATVFQRGNEQEEFFLAVTIICFAVNLMAACFYMSGVIQLDDFAIAVVDATIQLTSSFLLTLGGSLMLSSCIENSYHVDFQYKTTERTVSSIIGIITGLLYSYVGINAKRDLYSGSLALTPVRPVNSGGGKARSEVKRVRVAQRQERTSGSNSTPAREEGQLQTEEAGCIVS